MSDSLQIARILLSRLQPFSYCAIDLTDPETGDPLTDVCLLGVDDAGKSVLLSQLCHSVDLAVPPDVPDPASAREALVLTQFKWNDRLVYQARRGSPRQNSPADVLWLNESVHEIDGWHDLGENPPGFDEFRERFGHCGLGEDEVPPQPPRAFFGADSSLVDSCDTKTLHAFLESIVDEREREYRSFLELPENRERTVAEAEEEFETARPSLLPVLQDLWSSMLHKPIRINPEKCAVSPAADVAARGAQSLLLRTGCLLRQCFRRPDEAGFLFLDEPETGLHPAAALNVVKLYRSILGTRRTQLFAATHSPLIASQFSPQQRVRLGSGDGDRVAASRGIAPEGSDPNQILKRDFEIEEALGKKTSSVEQTLQAGRAAHDIDEQDEDELADLIDEASWVRKP
ncbi:MAG: AAA family ATPase [Verrucomicrobiales bacterium]